MLLLEKMTRAFPVGVSENAKSPRPITKSQRQAFRGFCLLHTLEPHLEAIQMPPSRVKIRIPAGTAASRLRFK
jgi:hypothetical protein